MLQQRIGLLLIMLDGSDTWMPIRVGHRSVDCVVVGKRSSLKSVLGGDQKFESEQLTIPAMVSVATRDESGQSGLDGFV